MMKAESIGLYVHVPFCVRKCAYCDFASFTIVDFPERDAYIDKLCEEIRGYAALNINVDTVFFGGGTPSLLSGKDFRKITDCINSSFNLNERTEFTVEANPGTLTRENLSCYIDCGANRLSIGLQSIHDNELKKLGRIHTYADFLKSYTLARKMKISNINVDLMYGIPDQTADSFHETLNAVSDLAPEHVSVYNLILEEGTELSESVRSLRLPDEDEDVAMYHTAASVLAGGGYEHYEISNYAKIGYKCLHNLKYWRLQDYIGVGLSAHSYLQGKRYANTSDPYVYISSNGKQYAYEERIDRLEAAFEYAMLAFRTSDGLSLSEYRNRFGLNFADGREKIISEFLNHGFMKQTDDRLVLTESGFYVSNTILAELL